MRAVIVPSARSKAKIDANYRRSVQTPVKLEEIAPHISVAELDRLVSAAGGGPYRLWGTKPGKNTQAFKRIQRDDIGVFTGDNHVYASFRIVFKFSSRQPELARSLWQTSDDGRAWEHVYVITDVRDEFIGYPVLRAAVGKSDAWIPQGIEVFEQGAAVAALRQALTGKSDSRVVLERQVGRAEPFIFTWNPNSPAIGGHSNESIESEDLELAQYGFVDTRWPVLDPSIAIRQGDVAFLYRMRRGKIESESPSRGLLRMGVVTGESIVDRSRKRLSNQSGDRLLWVPLRWTSFVSVANALPEADLLRFVPGVKWSNLSTTPQHLTQEAAVLLSALWKDHLIRAQNPELSDFDEVESVDVQVNHPWMRKFAAKRGQGYMTSAVQRAIVERAAVNLAIEHFKNFGWAVQDCGLTEPYDLHCTKDASTLNVEVKGTTTDGMSIFLTRGEVVHHQQTPHESALVVVSGLRWVDSGRTAVHAEEAVLRVVMPWTIDDKDLTPRDYVYAVPVPEELEGDWDDGCTFGISGDEDPEFTAAVRAALEEFNNRSLRNSSGTQT